MAVQNSLRTKLLKNVWVLLALIFFAGSVVLVLFFTSSQTKQLNLRNRIEHLKQEVAEKESLQMKQEEIDKVIKSISVMSGEEKRISPALSFLVSAADISGSSLGKIEFGEWQNKEKFNQAGIQFTLAGNYDNIGKFLNYLERKKPAILIQGMKITKVENTLKADVRGSIFVLK